MNKTNRVQLGDSYKYSHPMGMYPENTTYMFDYMESRGGEYPSTVFIGLEYILKEYFSTPITMDEVDEASAFATAHGIPFDYVGWEYIVKDLGGMLPIRIKAVKEGAVVPVKNAIMTIESTDPKVFWVVSWFETFAMKLWYPITVATKSFYVKKMLKEFSDKTGSGFVDFQYHNFGDRGSSSVESAAIGGMAHLSQFSGTDNFHALKLIKDTYGSNNIGFSIPASEHSTVTSWGRDKEFNFYDNYLEKFKGSPIIACVMDSYDIYKAVDYVTSGEFKNKVESAEYPLFVIRPDSGEPIDVISKIIDIMGKNNVSFEFNDKGYKVFNNYRIIWGDGITPKTIEEILKWFTANGYSSDNFAFGSGGDLMQNVNRDTQKFAIKCSSIDVNGISRDVFKDPITDPGKVSKKGKLNLFKGPDGYFTTENNREWSDYTRSAMDVVFENGIIKRTQTFENIKSISEKGE